MRDILLVIDMQNDFVDGALGTKEAEAVVEPVLAEIKKYAPCDIFATRDTHEENYLNTQEGKKLPVTHCVKGTAGWELYPEIAKALKMTEIIDKPTFGSKVLAEKLAVIAGQEKIRVTIVGVCTDICVVSNALLIKAYLPEVPIRVLSSCCAGVTPKSHEAALDTMRMCQIEVV